MITNMKKEKKEGYTLIETITVMFMVLILFSAISHIGNSIKKIKEYVAVKGTILEVVNIISYGKQYCRNSEGQGIVEIYMESGEVKLKDVSSKYKIIKEIKLPKGLRFLSNQELYINNKGQIESNTIRILDSDKNLYRITISTGVDTINIYEE